MRGGKVLVHRFADGRLRFSYKERVLTCTAYGTYAVPDCQPNMRMSPVSPT
jgi:hypothetical protein